MALTQNDNLTYLTFLLGDEEYGIDILQVLEIIKHMEPTEIPGSPDEMLGVINLRGQVIPVICLRGRFGFETMERNNRCVIIVVESAKGKLGFAVDQVQEVITFDPADIEAAPDYGLHIDTQYIHAIAHVDDHVRILLDITKVLSEDSAAAVMDATGAGAHLAPVEP